MATYLDNKSGNIIQVGRSLESRTTWVGLKGVFPDRGWDTSFTPYFGTYRSEIELLKSMGIGGLEELTLISELPESFPKEVAFIRVCEILKLK